MIPTNEELERVEQSVIEKVNQIRLALGMDLLKNLYEGFRFSAISCPISRSLSKNPDWNNTDVDVSVGIDTIYFYDTESVGNALEQIEKHLTNIPQEECMRYDFVTPDEFKEFIQFFDLGYYSHLDKEEKHAV